MRTDLIPAQSPLLERSEESLSGLNLGHLLFAVGEVTCIHPRLASLALAIHVVVDVNRSVLFAMAKQCM